jgi:hypothetical protein
LKLLLLLQLNMAQGVFDKKIGDAVVSAATFDTHVIASSSCPGSSVNMIQLLLLLLLLPQVNMAQVVLDKKIGVAVVSAATEVADDVSNCCCCLCCR